MLTVRQCRGSEENYNTTDKSRSRHGIYFTKNKCPQYEGHGKVRFRNLHAILVKKKLEERGESRRHNFSTPIMDISMEIFFTLLYEIYYQPLQVNIRCLPTLPHTPSFFFFY